MGGLLIPLLAARLVRLQMSLSPHCHSLRAWAGCAGIHAVSYLTIAWAFEKR
jgi:hypothetical protein